VISLISSVASPTLVMHTEAAGTSIPVEVPSLFVGYEDVWDFVFVAEYG